MAQYIGIVWNSLGANYSVNDGIQSATFVEVHKVNADSAAETQDDIKEVPEIPSLGDEHPDNSRARVKDISVDEVEPLVFEVAVEYSTATTEDDKEDESNDPENRRPMVSWSFRTIQRVLEEDFDGNPTNNSAGTPLQPTYDEIIPVMTVERYKRQFDPSEVLNYVDTTNDGDFYGLPAEHALISGISAKEVKLEGEVFWQVTHTVEFRVFRNWRLRLLDHGPVFFNAQGEKENFKIDGQPTTGNLDGNGGQAPDGIVEFLTFKQYPTSNFNDLDLGPFN